MDSRIMKGPVYIIFYLALSLYLLFRWGLYNFIEASFLKSYLSDLLCLPVIYGISLLILRRLKKNPAFYLSIPMMLVIFIEYSLIFEWYLPAQSQSFTGDPFDVVAYFIGGVVFALVQQYEKNKLIAKAINRSIKRSTVD